MLGEPASLSCYSHSQHPPGPAMFIYLREFRLRLTGIVKCKEKLKPRFVLTTAETSG